MLDVYYYMPKDSIESVICCGLKLSEWYDTEVRINDDMKKCISTLLNPRDDMGKYKSDKYRLLGFAVEEKYCYVADRYLLELSKDSEEIRELYFKTIVPVGKYMFGAFRRPECLVLSTVMAEDIHIADKGLNLPLIYENSEKLYIGNILENLREKNDNINDTLLYYFYNKLAELKKVIKIEDKDKSSAVFLDLEKSAAFCIKIPDGEIND